MVGYIHSTLLALQGITILKEYTGALRVLNDDTVQEGMGFGVHPHENMEIISIPLKGALKHNDSTGREAIIRTNDVQIMSAGTGIMHSEVNASREEEVKFLQIWVLPKKHNITPRYEQKTFLPENRVNKFQVVVSPEHKEAVWINQDAYFSLTKLEAGKSLEYQVNRPSENGVYFFVLEGEVELADEHLEKRDALGIQNIENVNLQAKKTAEVLVMEVPMKI